MVFSREEAVSRQKLLVDEQWQLVESGRIKQGAVGPCDGSFREPQALSLRMVVATSNRDPLGKVLMMGSVS